MPRSYQVTPNIPGPATSDTTKGSQATRPTASKGVSSPPPGSLPSGRSHRKASKHQASSPSLEVKASADETGGRFGLIESHQAGDVPLHVHENDDEAFYILEGEYEIRCGEQIINAGPGTFVYLPHGVPHAQTLKSETAKKLILIAPGGFENWFLERSEAMADGRYDDALADELNSRYGIKWLD